VIVSSGWWGLDRPRASGLKVIEQPEISDVLTRIGYDRQPPVRAQNSPGLGQGRGSVVKMMDHRDQHRRVEALVIQPQVLCVAAKRPKALRLSAFEHSLRVVDNERIPAGSL
jgi:hypothetical protein